MLAEGHPDWLVPSGLPAEVGALMSSRQGGVSAPPFDGLNLRPPGLPGQPQDEVAAVLENQRRWGAALAPARPVWLDQVHGHRVVRVSRADCHDGMGPFHQADASVTAEPGVACTALVADCLPVLFAAPGGRAVGAAHAGWRGLAAGVLEHTVAEVCALARCEPSELHAWLGACIGPSAFEVGGDVREAFGVVGEVHFRPTGASGKWWADLPGLARQRLQAVGLRRISGGEWCTHQQASRFFSYRRDRVTGRLAASVWIR